MLQLELTVVIDLAHHVPAQPRTLDCRRTFALQGP